MASHVKARFSNGTLMPLEPLELDEGTEVTLHIVKVASANATPPAPRQTEEGHTPDPGTHPVLAMIDRLREEFPDLADDDLPTDLSKNIDHYLYGTPKESD